MAFGEWSLMDLIWTHEPFVMFSLPCPVAKGCNRVTSVGSWHPPWVNPLHWSKTFGTGYEIKSSYVFENTAILADIKLLTIYHSTEWRSHRISTTYNLCYLQWDIALHCKFFIAACDFVAAAIVAFCILFNSWGKALSLKNHLNLETDTEKPQKANQ